jgi:hypothetical protein
MIIPAHSLLIRAFCVCVLAVVPGQLLANTIQVSPTVSFEGADVVGEGFVITVDSIEEQYSISARAHHDSVYGVTAAQPALVFQTGEQEVPVVTDGITYVQVSNQGGQISRGDFLVTAELAGVARKAADDESFVFAIALEDYQSDAADQIGFIQADVSVERAVLALEAGRQAQMSTEDTTPDPISIVRAVIAVVLLVGGLFFVLYSFRSNIKAGVVSVGRNPRARSSIVALMIGNLTFALVLCAVVVFIAVAILILPV